jgi:hypothetical protein
VIPENAWQIVVLHGVCDLLVAGVTGRRMGTARFAPGTDILRAGRVTSIHGVVMMLLTRVAGFMNQIENNPVFAQHFDGLQAGRNRRLIFGTALKQPVFRIPDSDAAIQSSSDSTHCTACQVNDKENAMILAVRISVVETVGYPDK